MLPCAGAALRFNTGCDVSEVRCAVRTFPQRRIPRGRIGSYPYPVYGQSLTTAPNSRRILVVTSKGGDPVYHWMDGWDWFWMSFMMIFWIVVLGLVVYVAVRLANRPPRGPHTM